MKTIEQIIMEAAAARTSDIHMEPGVPVKIRVDGQLTNLDDNILTPEDMEEYGRVLAGRHYNEIEEKGELDLALTIGDHRCRINLYRIQGNLACALRILSDKIPALSELGLPPAISQIPNYQKGIVLVTGETGSGKSTTLASIIDQINHTRYDHIITLEDPVEYQYKPDKSLISQREIGKDTESYASGLKAILREDPDVILIGEMRDTETIDAALTAAETGHLVFATLHTNSAVDSIDRIVGTYPAGQQNQVKIQLAGTLKAVISQQLLVRKSGHGRVAACEVMVVNSAIRNQIREGKTAQMQSSLLAGSADGSITMDNSLIGLYEAKLISAETAIAAAADPAYVKKTVSPSNAFGGTSSYGSINR
ncbi:MAG: PilT/PilU family type 4a pilus ATPase [Erysipelotrichaceae bacterium]|nr:PilT/PilU family type 4a pilus ATPase [Erysipelotrichaceae bacterium]